MSLDLDAIRARLATLSAGWWHADVDNQATSDALDAVIDDDMPALLAEVERLRGELDEAWQGGYKTGQIHAGGAE